MFPYVQMQTTDPSMHRCQQVLEFQSCSGPLPLCNDTSVFDVRDEGPTW